MVWAGKLYYRFRLESERHQETCWYYRGWNQHDSPPGITCTQATCIIRLFKVKLDNLPQQHNTNSIQILLQGARPLTGNCGGELLWTSTGFRSTCAVPQDLQISLYWGETQNNHNFHLGQRDPLCLSSSLTESKKASSWWDNDSPVPYAWMPDSWQLSGDLENLFLQ